VIPDTGEEVGADQLCWKEVSNSRRLSQPDGSGANTGLGASEYGSLDGGPIVVLNPVPRAIDPRRTLRLLRVLPLDIEVIHGAPVVSAYDVEVERWLRCLVVDAYRSGCTLPV
jgi:hypothetical protein